MVNRTADTGFWTSARGGNNSIHARRNEGRPGDVAAATPTRTDPLNKLPGKDDYLKVLYKKRTFVDPSHQGGRGMPWADAVLRSSHSDLDDICRRAMAADRFGTKDVKDALIRLAGVGDFQKSLQLVKCYERLKGGGNKGGGGGGVLGQRTKGSAPPPPSTPAPPLGIDAWNTLLRTATRTGHWLEALSIAINLRERGRGGEGSSGSSEAAAAAATSQGGGEGQEGAASASSGGDPSAAAALLPLLSSASSNSASSLSIQQKAVPFNAQTYTECVLACGAAPRGRQWHSALKVLRAMMRDQYTPNSTLMASFLRQTRLAGQWSVGLAAMSAAVNMAARKKHPTNLKGDALNETMLSLMHGEEKQRRAWRSYSHSQQQQLFLPTTHSTPTHPHPHYHHQRSKAAWLTGLSLVFPPFPSIPRQQVGSGSSSSGGEGEREKEKGEGHSTVAAVGSSNNSRSHSSSSSNSSSNNRPTLKLVNLCISAAGSAGAWVAALDTFRCLGQPDTPLSHLRPDIQTYAALMTLISSSSHDPPPLVAPPTAFANIAAAAAAAAHNSSPTMATASKKKKKKKSSPSVVGSSSSSPAPPTLLHHHHPSSSANIIPLHYLQPRGVGVRLGGGVDGSGSGSPISSMQFMKRLLHHAVETSQVPASTELVLGMFRHLNAACRSDECLHLYNYLSGKTMNDPAGNHAANLPLSTVGRAMVDALLVHPGGGGGGGGGGEGTSVSSSSSRSSGRSSSSMNIHKGSTSSITDKGEAELLAETLRWELEPVLGLSSGGLLTWGDDHERWTTGARVAVVDVSALCHACMEGPSGGGLKTLLGGSTVNARNLINSNTNTTETNSDKDSSRSSSSVSDMADDNKPYDYYDAVVIPATEIRRLVRLAATAADRTAGHDSGFISDALPSHAPQQLTTAEEEEEETITTQTESNNKNAHDVDRDLNGSYDLLGGAAAALDGIKALLFDGLGAYPGLRVLPLVHQLQANRHLQSYVERQATMALRGRSSSGASASSSGSAVDATSSSSDMDGEITTMKKSPVWQPSSSSGNNQAELVAAAATAKKRTLDAEQQVPQLPPCSLPLLAALATGSAAPKVVEDLSAVAAAVMISRFNPDATVHVLTARTRLFSRILNHDGDDDDAKKRGDVATGGPFVGVVGGGLPLPPEIEMRRMVDRMKRNKSKDEDTPIASSKPAARGWPVAVNIRSALQRATDEKKNKKKQLQQQQTRY